MYHYDYLFALSITAVELLGPGLALDNGVYGLQVRRIGADGQTDVLVCDAVQTLYVRSQMVLYISRALGK